MSTCVNSEITNNFGELCQTNNRLQKLQSSALNHKDPGHMYKIEENDDEIDITSFDNQFSFTNKITPMFDQRDISKMHLDKLNTALTPLDSRRNFT
jgi:hypothetical protein